MTTGTKNKNHRGAASQFFVAGELCRRGLVAVVTMGNTPNTDILCSNIAGTKFVHIQVKTYRPGDRTVSVGRKAEEYYGDNFIWVLSGIPSPSNDKSFEYYIIPSSEVSQHVKEAHLKWLDTPGKNGQVHNDNTVRTIHIPPYKSAMSDWSIDEYKNNWKIIENLLQDENEEAKS
ncbi:MAG: hypothetical protein ACKO37_08295 [Vampirovibrionales bacterium]